MTQEISGSPHRLALVTGCLDLGGTTTFLCNLAGELVRRAIPVSIFNFEHDNPLAPDFSRLQIRVFSCDERRLIYEDRLRLLLHELAAFQPTVVLANLSSTSFEVLRYLPPGVFRFGTAQSHDPGVYGKLRHYAPHVDLMGAVSKTIQASLQALPEFARVPVAYMPYGVPMPEQPPARDWDSGAPLRILYLGRLSQEQKRVRLFPQILDGLRVAGIPFHWTIAGEGPERDFLQAAMHGGAPGGSVAFPGRILYGDVPQVLSAHDVFLLASDYEGLPLSLLEAMAWGLVPVVSDLPSGVREVVDAASGKLVKPDNTAGYGAAIVQLHRDRAEAGRLSQNAQERVRREFSVSAMTDRWLAALPREPAAHVQWPTRWSPKAILEAPDRWRFWGPVRILRRLALRLRARA